MAEIRHRLPCERKVFLAHQSDTKVSSIGKTDTIFLRLSVHSTIVIVRVKEASCGRVRFVNRSANVVGTHSSEYGVNGVRESRFAASFNTRHAACGAMCSRVLEAG
jgi:hypothetical protein